MTKFLAYLFVVTFAAAFVGYQIWASGYVGQQIWSWYVLPLWSALPVLTWKHFFVAGALRRLAFGGGIPDTNKKDDPTTAIAKAIVVAVAPWMVLLIAWWIR